MRLFVEPYFAEWTGLGLLGTVVLVYFLTSVLYNLYLSPLRRVPGHLLARCNGFFLLLSCFLGIEGHVISSWHRKYKTPVLRVAPNSISLSNPASIRDVYITAGGFAKDQRYKNFNLGPVVTIFSSLDTEYRDVRAKAVAPLFATGRLRAAGSPGGVIGDSIGEFVAQLKAVKAARSKMDLLDACARLSIDVVTGYLLGERYGGLAEQGDGVKLSANPFIFAVVAWSRFSLLPHWLFKQANRLHVWLSASDEVRRSFSKLGTFVKRAMVSRGPDSYHGRLLAVGVRDDEAAAQAMAIVFAGTDSTAVMLTTIIFHLTRSLDARARVLAEIRASDPNADPRTLPFLQAAVKEGLRLGMANPTRLTRVVPPQGFEVDGYFLPAGTIVGAAAYTLHHDPDVFPDPFSFRPERWLSEGRDNSLHRPQMEKSILAFGAGLRACIGKNLALEELYRAVYAVVDAEVLEGATACQDRIEIIEWMNGEIKGHHLEIQW